MRRSNRRTMSRPRPGRIRPSWAPSPVSERSPFSSRRHHRVRADTSRNCPSDAQRRPVMSSEETLNRMDEANDLIEQARVKLRDAHAKAKDKPEAQAKIEEDLKELT